MFYITCLAAGMMGHWFPQNYSNLTSKILNQYSEELKLNKGYQAYVSGGSMTTDIREVAIGFQISKPINLSDARKIYVEISSELLRRFNNDKSIRPYLHNYPFTCKNLRLKLSFIPLNGGDFLNGEMRYVTTINGIITYDILNSETREFQEIHRESYEEALSIVHQASIAQQKIAEGATQ